MWVDSRADTEGGTGMPPIHVSSGSWESFDDMSRLEDEPTFPLKEGGPVVCYASILKLGAVAYTNVPNPFRRGTSEKSVLMRSGGTLVTTKLVIVMV